MIKTKVYDGVRFSADIIREASMALDAAVKSPKPGDLYLKLSVEFKDESWEHDNEDEFFADVRREPKGYVYRRSWYKDISVTVYGYETRTTVSVDAPSREIIERICDVFNRNVEHFTIPKPPAPSPNIFIGHGHSAEWRDLKDHLHDKHNIEIIAYEIGARAGHEIRDILADMLSKSSMALIVLTAEDETIDGGIRARQNVVHEAGLFQGRLGFERAILIAEEGIESFSNISGIQQIRFSRGNIRGAFGDVLATIKREFPQQ